MMIYQRNRSRLAKTLLQRLSNLFFVKTKKITQFQVAIKIFIF